MRLLPESAIRNEVPETEVLRGRFKGPAGSAEPSKYQTDCPLGLIIITRLKPASVIRVLPSSRRRAWVGACISLAKLQAIWPVRVTSSTRRLPVSAIRILPLETYVAERGRKRVCLNSQATWPFWISMMRLLLVSVIKNESPSRAAEIQLGPERRLNRPKAALAFQIIPPSGAMLT